MLSARIQLSIQVAQPADVTTKKKKKKQSVCRPIKLQKNNLSNQDTLNTKMGIVMCQRLNRILNL